MSTEEQSTASDLPQPSASNLAQAGASDLPRATSASCRAGPRKSLLGSTEPGPGGLCRQGRHPRVFPMLFHWTGEEAVLCTFAGAAKIHAIRARPDIAVTIDAPTTPPRVLLLRGRATVDEVDGIVPEYRQAHLRYAGPEQGEANVAAVDNPGVRMARIGLRPTWVGVLGFVARLPGGVSAEEFDRRGS